MGLINRYENLKSSFVLIYTIVATVKCYNYSEIEIISTINITISFMSVKLHPNFHLQWYTTKNFP